MNKFLNLFIFISIFINLFISNTIAKKTKKHTKESIEDNYYLVFVKTDERYIFPTKSIEKRHENNEFIHENNEFINAMVKEIQNLIIDNKDTFKNVTKLEEINKSSLLKKRDDSNNDLENDLIEHPYDYDESNLVFPISSVEDETVILAYLSEKLINVVKSLPNVIGFASNREIKLSTLFDTYYNLDDIKQETKWKNVEVREKASLHLSLISQGKYNDTLINKYDRSYYYPSSAGQDVDIIVLDTGFNFNHTEFSNLDERSVKCECSVRKGKIETDVTDIYCHRTRHTIDNHGIEVTVSASGKNYGAASKANIYAILLDGNSTSNIIRALEYVRDNLIRPHKTVINMSFGDYFDENDSTVLYLEKILSEITNAGGISVASAGNNNGVVKNFNNTNSNMYPCYIKDVICVGAIYDHYDHEKKLEVMDKTYYKKAKFSNFGEGVDIYAPGYSMVSYLDDKNKLIQKVVSGTSYSAPITSGVIATLLSEYPEKKFDKNSILDYLIKIGLKGAINDIPEGILINNGKHIVYSEDYLNMGCGVNAGNSKCGESQCCTDDGRCVYKTESACQSINGCQIEFGECTVVKSTKEDRCGKGYGSCEEGYCCSSEGYCGKTSSYCDVGCQKNYGLCN